MEKNSLLPIIETIIKLPRGVIKETDLMADFGGWDSLAVLEFITEVDKNFGVILSPSEIYKAKTVIDLLSLVK